MSAGEKTLPPRLSATTDFLGRWVASAPEFWVKLGNFESKLLAPDIADKPVVAPVYICGLARSGSTVLLEMLAGQPGMASHRYQDFPFLFTPYWWNKLLAINPLRHKTLTERAHGDGMLVSPQSPEAMEEMLWMAFFEDAHDPDYSAVLGAECDAPAFARFYREHITKFLLARKAKRYLCKNNYNITRLGYLNRMFPDARFIIPVRDPVTHIASLVRQHRRFSRAGKDDPRGLLHMSIAGHHEFGLGRLPINAGEPQKLAAVQEAWENGQEIRGWALYWDMLYGFIKTQLDATAHFGGRALVVRFEDLYTSPECQCAIFAHAQTAPDTATLQGWAGKLAKPAYYQPDVTPQEISLIHEITGQTAAGYGYSPQ